MFDSDWLSQISKQNDVHCNLEVAKARNLNPSLHLQTLPLLSISASRMDICRYLPTYYVPAAVHVASAAAMLWAEINVNRIQGPGNQNDDANSPANIQKFRRLMLIACP